MTDTSTEAPSDTGTDASPYAQWYYAHCCGKPYDVTDPGWLAFFDDIADRLIATVAPATALDAGCAMGILVGSLRSRGVDASGVDISAYAVEHGDPRAQGRLRVGRLEDPLSDRYDLVTCIEVLEHIEAGAVDAVIANLCAASEAILLSTTPEDFNEGTHVNVRPPAYWLALFADHGFYRRFDVDASFVSPWAVLLERRTAQPRRLIAEYETQLWDLRRDNRGTRAALLNRDRQIAELLASGDARSLQRDLKKAERELKQARAEARTATRKLHAVRASRRYRLGAALLSPLSRLRRSSRRG
jgi:2-polyprenyl-3-methyl-5-hydroxy-6-metoxy-1,4-benzoquinol methylase